MYLQLSWRNIWRNKKRTLIAAASVFFAVILAVFMRSGQLGSYSYMIHSAAQIYTGYFQVMGNDYWEERSLEESIVVDDSLLHQISSLENIVSITPRLESFALVSHLKETKVSQVIGIDPVAENAMNGLKKRLVKGKYLDANSSGILLAEGLARMLHADIGDSLVLYGVGYHGVPAAALLPVIGIVELPFPTLNNGTVFLNMEQAQYVYAAYGRITSLSIMISDIEYQDELVEKVNSILPEKMTIMAWEEIMPELKQNIEFDNIGGIIMLLILYIVIAFGVFGTIMMMTQERAREFGILVSVGMQKIRLMKVTLLESLMVSFVGAIAGMVGAIPLIIYLYYNPVVLTGEAADAYLKLGIEPIMAFTGDPMLFVSQGMIVLLIALLSAVYPVMFIRALKPSQAVRG